PVPRLGCPNSEREFWVSRQGYATEPWSDLVNLWLLLNRHLLHIVKAMPDDVLAHELVIGGHDAMTLRALTASYLDHMEHHLGQIFACGAASHHAQNLAAARDPQVGVALHLLTEDRIGRVLVQALLELGDRSHFKLEEDAIELAGHVRHHAIFRYLRCRSQVLEHRRQLAR